MISEKNVREGKEGLSIVVPAYNEKDGIEPVLAELHRIMHKSGWPYEIIVIDDGSTDDTATQVNKSQNTLLIHPTNQGYGAALKTGIRHACYDIVAITDADGTYPSESIVRLKESLLCDGYDMIVGARLGKQAAVPFARRPAKWALTRLAEFVAGQPITDLNSGLRVFRRSTALQCLDLLPDGFSFTATITLAMLTNRYRVGYVPIDYHSRTGRSKIRPVRDTVGFIGLILRIALYFAPLKIFVPLAGLILFLGISWGLFTRFVLGELADVSTIIIVMGAFQVAMLGLLAELVNKRSPNLFKK